MKSRRMAHHFSHSTAPLRLLAQRGFTMIELLVSILVVMVIVVAVQRYVAGVLTDRADLSAQQDQMTQINIVLNNVQTDVARAGFIPVASADVPTDVANKVGLEVRCVGADCKNQALWLAYWTRENPAYDCLHSRVLSARTAGWVRVENIYQFHGAGTSSDPLVFGCDGNGGAQTWRGMTDPEDGDIQDYSWRLDAKADGQGLLHFCMNIRHKLNAQIAGRAPFVSCTSNALVSNGMAFRTIELDMRVQATQSAQTSGAP